MVLFVPVYNSLLHPFTVDSEDPWERQMMQTLPSYLSNLRVVPLQYLYKSTSPSKNPFILPFAFVGKAQRVTQPIG